MTKIYQITILIILIFTNVSCDYIFDDFEYEKKSIKFIKDLLMKNYDNCIIEMEIKNENGLITNDSIKLGLDSVRKEIITDFGKNLEFETIEAKTTYPLLSKEKHYTNVLIQIKNKKQFGLLEIIFNSNNKIEKIYKYDLKENIPKMEMFWVVAILTFWIPFFNLYIIYKVRKSNLKWKKTKYWLIVLFNAPSFIYNATYGFSFQPYFFKFLGVEFGLSSYLETYWIFCIPIGGIYCLIKLNDNKNKSKNIKKLNQIDTL